MAATLFETPGSVSALSKSKRCSCHERSLLSFRKIFLQLATLRSSPPLARVPFATSYAAYRKVAGLVRSACMRMQEASSLSRRVFDPVKRNFEAVREARRSPAASPHASPENKRQGAFRRPMEVIQILRKSEGARNLDPDLGMILIWGGVMYRPLGPDSPQSIC
jgi:hypothetical protein